jgi:ABC-type antimicrobial peptide transport system permease subunit
VTLAIAESAWATRERPAPAEAFRECEVIGVARDVVGELDQDDRRLIYLPFALDAWPWGPVFLRPRSDSAAALREIVRVAQEGNVGLQWGQTLSAWREQMVLPQTMLAYFSAILGGLALVLASVGLYGVIAFIVSQRVREIGIRMALGATAQRVVGLFVRQGMRLVAVGVVFGLIGGRLFALALSKISDGGGLNTFNATAFAGTALLFAGIAWFACWLPARRAAKVDPMVALRAE